MALSSNFDAFKVQTLENILAQTAAPTVLEWPSYGNFWRGHSKGGAREILQNRPKSKPRL